MGTCLYLCADKQHLLSPVIEDPANNDVLHLSEVRTSQSTLLSDNSWEDFQNNESLQQDVSTINSYHYVLLLEYLYGDLEGKENIAFLNGK